MWIKPELYGLKHLFQFVFQEREACILKPRYTAEWDPAVCLGHLRDKSLRNHCDMVRGTNCNGDTGNMMKCPSGTVSQIPSALPSWSWEALLTVLSCVSYFCHCDTTPDRNHLKE